MSETSSPSQPPEVTINMATLEDLPEDSLPWDDVKLPIDIILLTAIQCEFLACISVLKPGYYKSLHKDLGYVYFGETGKDRPDNLKIALIKCQKGSTGPGGSASVVKDAVVVLKPKAVFCVGFCGGLEKVELGHVVLARKLITYAMTKITESGIEERGERVLSTIRIQKLILSAGESWKAPLRDRNDRKVNVLQDGVFLSGPEVVNNRERREELMRRFPDANAIETEGEGLYAAAHDLEVEWIVIKGVSDFADGNKSQTDSWRPFASLMAASFTAHILSNPKVFQNWPHYGNASKSTLETGGKRPLPIRSTHGAEKKPKKMPMKDGPVDEYVLEELSEEIGDAWEKLARRLGFKDSDITGFHKNNEEYAKKAYKMLKKWREKLDLEATYDVLYEALCHKFVARKDLANKFCAIHN